jgi:predicted outer membrane repeat protein
MDDCTFTENTASIRGAILNNGDASIDGCTFTGNTSHTDGGAIFNYDNGDATITSCTFTENTADDGDGEGSFGEGSGSGGGAIYNTGDATIDGCTFIRNTAGYVGGAICNVGNAPMTMTSCTFTENTTSGGDVSDPASRHAPGRRLSPFVNYLPTPCAVL